jgi:hypothetical protein
MREDFLLTPTDVAEALGLAVAEVHDLIDTGDLPATMDRGWKVTHSNLARFISSSRSDALELGQDAPATPTFAASRPFENDEFD